MMHLPLKQEIPPPDAPASEHAFASRIVCVTHYFPSRKGGIEAVAFEINRRLAARDYSVEWFASASAVLPEAIPGLSYRPVPAIDLVERLFGIPLPIWISKDLLKLWSAIGDCDAVHIHDFIYPGSLLALAFARLRKKTVVLTQHIGDIPYRSRALTYLLAATNRILGRLALREASQVVFISNAVEAYFRAFVAFRTPPLYLPNGVDTSVFHPVSDVDRQTIRERLGFAEDARLCLFVGRFVEKKGLPMLADLVRATPWVQWLFAGEGPMHPQHWQAANVTVFEGWRRERLADLYRTADLLILPSRGEGFPLVVQEAFACGTPALVSDETAAGCEKARPLLFEISVQGSDVVNRWRESLSALFSQPVRLAARRTAVAEFSRQEWSWERVVDSYARFYAGSVAKTGDE